MNISHAEKAENKDLIFNNIEEIVGPIECANIVLKNFLYPDNNDQNRSQTTDKLTAEDLDYIEKFMKDLK